MREPDRDGVLEAALPRARHRQGRPPRGLRHPGCPPLSLLLPPSLPHAAGTLRIGGVVGLIRVGYKISPCSASDMGAPLFLFRSKGLVE